MTLDAAAVRAALRLTDDAAAWLAELEQLGPPDGPPPLPGADEAGELLDRLAVPAADAAEIVAALPEVWERPELRWLLDRTYHRVVDRRGDFTSMDMPPSLPYELGAAARYFYVYVFLAAVPAVRAYHAERGIPDDVAWGTLDQLGELVEIHRRQFGVGGMDKQFWLTLHLRGVIYRLGRLQFNLQLTGDGFGPLPAGTPVLGTHIPEVGGAFTAEACDASFARARPFYAAHFPEHGAELAFCTSWLLDPQLAEYLPETTNIVRFMRRWTPVDAEPKPGDDSVLEFVFRRNGQPLDELPQRTSLERAAVDHLRAGRHWRLVTGYLELP